VLRLSLDKCRFAAPEVTYLGYIVGREGLRVDKSKIYSLQAAVTPQTKTGIRRLLGMCGVYRRFIPVYAKFAVAFTRYLKDDIPDSLELDDVAVLAHSKLKEIITTAPILALPCPQGLYVLESDASAAQLGVQLLQQQPNESLRPIGFKS
jgi:RNase H-like domain found in reverse transcriptase